MHKGVVAIKAPTVVDSTMLSAGAYPACCLGMQLKLTGTAVWSWILLCIQWDTLSSKKEDAGTLQALSKGCPPSLQQEQHAMTRMV